MILTDRDIRAREKEIFEKGFQDDNINSVSYDVTVDAVISEDSEMTQYKLQPGETVFVRTAEEIHMPSDLMGRVAEKNSRMREGLWVTGPHYFPGHRTFLFLRVKNLSRDIITIRKGQKIAQIFFEELKDVPEKTYEQQENASFRDEITFRGPGKYEAEYQDEIQKVRDVKEDLDKTQGRIYANILTLMGLFVSIFSLIMVNFSQINHETVMDKKYLLTINLSLGFVISLFMGLVLLFVNRGKNRKWPVIVWIGIVILLFAGILLI